MILQHQFEIRQMELFGANEEQRKQIVEIRMRHAKEKIAIKISNAFEFESFINPYRYRMCLVVSTQKQYMDLQKGLSDILDEYYVTGTDRKRIGELFAKFENTEEVEDNNSTVQE
jgi:hypothetical protein